MADTVRGTIYPNLPGNCPDAGYKLVSKAGFIEAPLSSENLEWVKDEAITDADKEQIITNKNDIAELKTNKQDKLTPGTNITIDENNVISATGGGGGGFEPTQAQLDAMNSGIDSTKVSQIDTNADDIDTINDTISDIQTDLADKSEVSGTNDGTNWTKITIDGVEKNIPSGGSGGFEPTSAQLTAMNSGIDSNKVAQIATNTSDIANKVDKVTGKGLSTNDFTNADKTKLDGIDLSTKQDVLNTSQLNAVNSGIDSTKVAQIATNTTNIGNKVDKETGKGLSTNDYTTAEKNKVALINSTETLTFTLSGGTTVNLKVVTGV